MKKIKLTELSEDVRSFLLDALHDDGVMLEDATGRARGGLVPYSEASATERQQSWVSVTDIQEKASAALRDQGLSEGDVVKLVLEDD